MSFDSSRPANSRSGSKRSFNSMSSNDSNKKKQNQKTLGVAWGSNSLSSSRSSFRNSPFSDFGSYMEVKNRKLQDQFEAEASSSSKSGFSNEKCIFGGVSIFVDGYTVPSSQELRGYMSRYGGSFQNYFSRRRVTHIICSNLPDSKIKNLRSFSGGLPVVKPTWVVDSVAANKLLSWIPYELDQVASETHKQPKLSAFFTPSISSISNDISACMNDTITPEPEDPLLKGDTEMKASAFDYGEYEDDTNQCNGESDDLMLGNFPGGAVPDKPVFSNHNNSEVQIAEPTDSVMAERNTEIQAQPSPCIPSDSVSSYHIGNQNIKQSSSSTNCGTSNQHHSSHVDPNFVENYFKKSRLHFIGTWRNRYRKRFPSLSNQLKDTNYNLNASRMPQKASIIHVDMDCFFVSVVIRNNHELKDKPVAVCHSDNPRGTAEISSANYPARDYGVRAGMFVRDAKSLCPQIVILPYDFEAYEEVADQFYDILHKHCNKVQAVSCDEAFLDVTDSEMEDPQPLASIIRKEIFDTTGCTASAGVAGNMLLARLATRTAKPDGQCYIPPEKVDDYLYELPIKALPGIGRVLEQKLKSRQIKTCGELRMITKESLQKDFGIKTGDMLWNYSRGIDNRLVGTIQETKSIGAEVNWGVRFKDSKDSQNFLENLCKEVSLRLQGCAVQGRTFTLKVKKRRSDADEPIKYMGCGDCENLSHSITLPLATDDVHVLQRITRQLFRSFRVDVQDVRGMGLQVSKLESADNAKQGHERNSIRSWLVSASPSMRDQCRHPTEDSATKDSHKPTTDVNTGQSSVPMDGDMSNSDSGLRQDPSLPPLCDLDMDVIESLPPELFSEMNQLYGGKLKSLISKNRSKKTGACHLSSSSEGIRKGDNGPYPTNLISSSIIAVDEEKQNIQASSGAGTSNVGIPEKFDLMPLSLSQVDISVLEQLPEEMRVDIIDLLPAHRRSECESDVPFASAMPNPNCVNHTENPSGLRDSISSSDLWAGDRPLWVDKFTASTCWVLNTFSEMYYRSGSTGLFSSILQQIISRTKILSDATINGWDDAISCLSEVFKQYVKLKIEVDLEEIYVCFRLLRRLTEKSTFFLQVYDTILPHLQASVGEIYGGNFLI